MADLIFYTNPQSRGRIVRWMLEEVGQPYDTEIVRYDRMKDDRYLAVNPMGKVPAIQHRGQVVTECAAICAYLADVFPKPDSAPRDDEKADYYRWLFYAAGPSSRRSLTITPSWDPAPEQGRMFGYGNYDKVVSVLDELFSLSDYVCGDRFTAADVYVGSAIMWGTQFGTLPQRDSFARYTDRLKEREAFKRAGERRRSAGANPDVHAAAGLGETAVIASGAGAWQSERTYADDGGTLNEKTRQKAITLYDRFTHEGMERRVFMAEMVKLAGTVAAAELLIAGIAASPAAALSPRTTTRLPPARRR